MKVLNGKGVSGGIAFGKLELFNNDLCVILKTKVENTEEELKRFENARNSAAKQLEELYEKAVGEIGENDAMIFDIHKMMLEDEDFLTAIRMNITKQKLNAESAVAHAKDSFVEMFSNMEDSYMKARASDVKDISERIIQLLTNKERNKIKSKGKVIIGAEDLAPSETVQLDKSKILAFVTEKGSMNSHTSILARTMNIPAVIGATGIMNVENDNLDVIVDGFSGEVFIDPDMEAVLKLKEKKLKSDEQKELLEKLKGLDTVTKDGQEVLLYANINSVEDMPYVHSNDAMGVGLLRSEFVYLSRKTYPTEDEQFMIYKNAAQKSLGKRVIIRTLDIGADKQVDYFQMPKEENPAMGVRAIRICLSRPEIFKTQLRALFRATVFGKVAIMFPMITSLWEIKKIKEICNEVKAELKEEKIPFNENTEIGIMIETPAAVMICDKLAEEVDFFSVGTNDLLQYSFAVDRQNEAAAPFISEYRLVILRMIKRIVEASHNAGIWTGICGELAGDLNLTEAFLALGVDELSVSPGNILKIKQKIIETDVSIIREKILKEIE